jgi:hypothetical protein
MDSRSWITVASGPDPNAGSRPRRSSSILNLQSVGVDGVRAVMPPAGPWLEGNRAFPFVPLHKLLHPVPEIATNQVVQPVTRNPPLVEMT